MFGKKKYTLKDVSKNELEQELVRRNQEACEHEYIPKFDKQYSPYGPSTSHYIVLTCRLCGETYHMYDTYCYKIERLEI